MFVGTIGRSQIEAEGGAPGQRGIEEVDGKVGADAAIGEPAALQRLPALAVVHGVQWYGAEQQGKAQTHAYGDDYRQVVGQWQAQIPVAAIIAGALVSAHPGHHALGE